METGLSGNLHPLVMRFRTSLISLSTPQDFWTLRLITANHPRVFLNSLPLVFARCGGICRRGNLDDDVFTLGLAEDPMRNVADYEAVLDLLQAGTEALHMELDKVPSAVGFIVFLLCFAEGKQQRQTLRTTVLRAVHLLGEWLTLTSEAMWRAVTEALKAEFDGSEERVSGMFDRTAYYYKDSGNAEWVAKHWKEYSPDKLSSLHKRLFDEEGNYEYLFKLAVLRPDQFVNRELEQDLVQCWRRGSTNPAYLVALSLLFVYKYPNQHGALTALLEQHASADIHVTALLASARSITL
ncbi:hypothetical protein BASA81_012687 [Batrachochytrium salamandrivorans]|nr:hypothetical protein BASA81_012687 [Batrachochytrium salamandrivorans]